MCSGIKFKIYYFEGRLKFDNSGNMFLDLFIVFVTTVKSSSQWEPYVGRATVPAKMVSIFELRADQAKGILGKKFSIPENIF